MSLAQARHPGGSNNLHDNRAVARAACLMSKTWSRGVLVCSMTTDLCQAEKGTLDSLSPATTEQ
eukprot:6465815-Amphidinium_carterae.2